MSLPPHIEESLADCENSELSTAAQFNIPVKIIILNNGQYISGFHCHSYAIALVVVN